MLKSAFRMLVTMALTAGVCLVVVAKNGSAGAADTVILDTSGFWRLHHTFAPPVVSTDKGLKTILANKQAWLHEKTAEAADDWRLPTFDDSSWLRGPLRMAVETPMVSRLCARGKFTVTNPTKVKRLTISLGYYGGAIVYVNGTELRRGHLKPGDAGRDGLAEIYPKSLYFFGNTHSWDWLVRTSRVWDKKRTRVLTDIAVPRKLLRRGVNVVAVEIIRPPEQNEVMTGKVGRHSRRKTTTRMNWATCSARWVRMTAKSASGIVPNAARPKTMQVWNSDLLAADFDQDFADRTEKIQPIRIVGAGNGAFSGKVVVGSTRPLRNLRASVGALIGPGVIRPGSIRIRYGIPWGDDIDSRWRYTLPASMLGALSETPLAEVPVTRKIVSRYYGLKIPDPMMPRQGAVRSVWVTVDVPKHAAAGLYKGLLRISVKGEKPQRVPIHLKVEGWTLPDTDDYTTWVELMQSVDTLAMEYGLKLWSEEHWAMIARSMKHLNRIGSRILYIPVICYTNLGNSESMVRWIPKPGGGYTWDFSIMDRYIDTARVHMGKPKVVCMWVWDKFLYLRVDDQKIREYDKLGRRGASAGERQKRYVSSGPVVTMLSPATGKFENRQLRAFSHPESEETWKSFFKEVRMRLAARGIEQTLMIGTASDVVPRKETLAFFNKVAPSVPWIAQSHNVLPGFFKKQGGELGYYTTVFGRNYFPEYPVTSRHYGWKRKRLQAYLLRNWGRNWDHFPLTSWRLMAEVNITGDQRGVGHLGAEFWSVIRDKRGNRRGRIYLRYPEGNWRSNDICTALLAPGPKGPVATHRYEVMREGVQECEARIFIERALTDKKKRAKLGDALAKRCQDILDERIPIMLKGMSDLKIDSSISGMSTNAYSTWWNRAGIQGHKWFVASGWQERSSKLYAIAGEVEKTLKRR